MTAVWNAILLLLKWLGILLLVVLGLLIAVILLALFAPVRYRGKIKKAEAPEEAFGADGVISWLNPLLRVRLLYGEKKFRYKVRVLGICCYNSEKPKKERTKKEKKKKEKKEKKQSGKKNTTDNEASSVKENKGEPEDTRVRENTPELPGPETQIPLKEAEQKDTGESGKLRNAFRKITRIPAKIKQKITHIANTIKLLWHKKEKVVSFFEDELHRTAIGKAWVIIKKLLHHVLPGKIKGYVEFGTGEPESTGKALGVLGMLYGVYGKGVTIVPDFYEKRLVADVSLKGRIRLVTVLVHCLRLIRDKQMKRLYHNWKKLLKLLKQKAE